MKVPSVWRVLERDELAQVAAVFFLFGIAVTVAFAFSLDEPHVASPWWAAGGLMCLVPAPTRIWSMRRWFRHGPQVVGQIAGVGRASGGVLLVEYRYAYQGRSYTGTGPWLSAPRPEESDRVPILVDAYRPARSVLASMFIGDDRLPQARVVSR